MAGRRFRSDRIGTALWTCRPSAAGFAFDISRRRYAGRFLASAGAHILALMIVVATVGTRPEMRLQLHNNAIEPEHKPSMAR